MNNISYPRQNAIAARCHARMLKGERLAHRAADNCAGSYRLAGYVHYLEKKHNWEFERVEFTDDTRDPAGRRAIYTEYRLSEEMIKWAGDEGQKWASEVLQLEAERIARKEVAAASLAEAGNLEATHSNDSTLPPSVNSTDDDKKG